MSMMLTFQPMERESALVVLHWHYDPPYEMYNLDAYDAEATLSDLLDPENAYYAVRNEEGDLVAFCCFGADAQVPGGDYSAPALDVGLGVRPDLTGQGSGLDYVLAVLAFASAEFNPKAFRVSIALFNRRAQWVWERAGFVVVQRFRREVDGLSFVVMMRPAPAG
jgi:[ribosomal protein S18]-alanine N-acetyltransferase